jgi:dihydrofolate synthase/folylpolyglutamate synthase
MEFIHSVDWIGSRLGLDRMNELMEKMGNPQKACKFVHVAGTNGKGSVSCMLAAALAAAGYTVGLYTSPYIFHFNERIQVNGKQISDDELAEITTYVAPFARSMEDHPTEFEVVTAIAMEYFARRKCDIVVLEVGMGGRLDATNIISAPLCSVIMNIGLDHTEELGDTVEKIAGEKAGIIKENCPTVLYEQQQSVMDVIAQVCRQKNSLLHTADFSQINPLSDSIEGQRFSYKDNTEYLLPLLGAHQLKNAAVVLEVLEVLRAQGYQISPEAVAQGLADTRWPARFELVCRDPMFVVDGGHNPQCAETVSANLKNYFPNQKHVLLLGVLADKDYQSLTDILDQAADAYVTVKPNSPRAMAAEDLAAFLARYGKPVTACASIEEGVKTAVDLAKKNGAMACCVGSLYMAGPVRYCFGLE